MKVFSSLRRTLAFAAIALATAVFSLHADESQALLWMVDTPTILDHGVEKTIATYKSPDDLTITHARVLAVAKDPDGTSVYLNLSYEDPFLEEFVITEYSLAEIGNSKAGPIWAAYLNKDPSAGSFAMEDYSFRIELGTGSETDWHTLAVSDTMAYGDIKSHIAYTGLDMPSYTPWTPQIYTVPEPSGSLLFLIGGALLALRRKRKVEA